MSGEARSRLVSGIKPTGRLHLGNLEGALKTWVRLQDTYEAFCFIANWHAYTAPRDPEQVREDTLQAAIDCLAEGLDPARATLFVQSDVKEHAELYLLLSMIVPVPWLERVPTYKEQLAAAPSRPPSFGLLGYPVLQAADILLYGASVVPVGRDQLPHLELAREIARKFNQAYGQVFTEPAGLLGGEEVLPGVDGRKMSKAHGNAIFLSDTPDETARKIRAAFTTPSKLRSTDPGEPEGCVVCRLRRVYDPTGYQLSWEEDRRGERGCAQNKEELVELLNATLAPLRARRVELERRRGDVEATLRAGAATARAVAADTMNQVRRAMRLA